MASYNNFQSDNFKHDHNRTDIYNPEFNSFVKVDDVSIGKFERNLDKWTHFVGFMRFYPDLFYDMVTPETGGITLHLDQRVLLRCLSRFLSVYGVFNRGLILVHVKSC